MKKIKNVLIVDDDNSSRELLIFICENYSDDIKACGNGYDAIELCKKTNYDLIFMDIGLPIVNGYKSIKEIRKFDKNSIIIAQTGFDSLEIERLSLEAGCNYYIPKPICVKGLLKILDKISL